MMKHRDGLYKKFKKTNNYSYFLQYKTLRNKTNQTIRNSKLKYARSCLLTSPKEFWQKLRRFGIGGKGNSVESLTWSPDAINNHFSSVVPPANANVVNQSISDIQKKPCLYHPEFHFSIITDLDVLEAIKNVKSSSVGSDRISSHMIKNIITVILPTIVHLFNSSLGQGVFPACWKTAFVIPLPKCQIPETLSDLRPISILPFLAKVLEKIVHRQITDYLNDNNLMDPLQSGFRNKYSTSSALIHVSDDIMRAMDDSKLTVLSLLDFSKAFDSVDHLLLVNKFKYFNFDQTSLDWVSSYLSDRQQIVKIGNQMSQPCSILSGVLY